MTVDERLRAAMYAHDAEAPTRVPWPATRVLSAHRGPRVRFVLAVALVVVLVAGATWLAATWPRPPHTSAPTQETDALSCPATWAHPTAAGQDEVPAPATVPDPSARLVPAATPATVVVCGYLGGSRTLTSSSVLAGDLAPVTGALTSLPPGRPGACPDYLVSTDADDYLVGLSYPDGTVWVSAPGNHCEGAGNGAFTTPVNLHLDVSSWLAAGRYTVIPTTGGATGVPAAVSACPIRYGRLGQDAQMVPGTPSSLTVCLTAGLVSRASVVPADRLGALAAALNALPAQPDPGAVTGCGADVVYDLEFGYPTGPDVRVVVSSGCSPGVDNGRLQASSTSDLLDALYAVTH